MIQHCSFLQDSASPDEIIPTRSEIIKCLGSPLADIILQNSQFDKMICLAEIKDQTEFKDLSYDQYLKNKANLRPPLNDQRVKALTHEGILALGEQILQKFKKVQNLKKKEEFEEDMIEKRYLFAAEKRRALDLQREELRLEHEKCYNELYAEMRLKLEKDLKKTKEEYHKELKNCIIKERLNVMQDMMQRMSDEMSDIIISLCKSFYENLTKERSNFIKVFNCCLNVERNMFKDQIKEIERKRVRDLLYQKEELQVQNLTNLTYVMCLEKMKYHEKTQKLKSCYQKKVIVLQKLIISLMQLCQRRPEGKEINTVVQEDEIHFYKCKILELIKQFQKLIDFTFDEIPGQADFLINFESFISLTKHLDEKKPKSAVTQKKYSITEFIVDENEQKWKPEQSILKYIDKEGIMEMDFENYIYTNIDDPNKTKPMCQLLEKNAQFYISIDNKIN